MAAVKKNIVVLFVAVALGGALMVCKAQSSVNTTEPNEPDPGMEDSESQSLSLFSEDPNFSNDADYGLGKNELFFRAVFAVLVVIVLGITAVYVSKKLLPKITKLPGREIHIIETVYLGQRKAVHLIEMGNRRFLIGSTNENITRLADVSDSEKIQSQQFTDGDRELDG